MKNTGKWIRSHKEAIVKFTTIALAAAFVVVAITVFAASGCRQARAPTPEAQTYEISRGSNFMAQTTETIEVAADIHLADRPRPVRVKLRIRPGTWVVPEQMLSIGGPLGPGTVCTENYCEVRK